MATAPGAFVTLMTLHAAKGLEFPVVFLTGMEDGIFPHERTLADPTELAEERRLAYVGLTRARQRLYISRSATRRGWGEPRYYPPSRFLDDIPADLLDWRRLPEPAMAAAAQRIAPVGGFGGRRQAGPGLRPVVALAPGDRVTHSAWGMGTVVATSGEADKARARIDFGGRRRGQGIAAPLCAGREALTPGHDGLALSLDAVEVEPQGRVHPGAVRDVNLEVKMRAGRVAGAADVSELLSGRHELAHLDGPR